MVLSKKCRLCYHLVVICCLVPGLAGPTSIQAEEWLTYKVDSTKPAGGLASTAELSLAKERLQEYGPSYKQLSVHITPETASRLHVKVSPKGVKRWEVPNAVVARPGPEAGLSSSRLLYQMPQLRLQQPFALSVVRAGGKGTVFDTTGSRFLFKDQYIEFTTAVPADCSLYGLGESTLPGGLLLPRNGHTMTLWSRDKSAAYVNANLYGTHSFYLQVNKDGSSHGVFLLNSNGMDVVLNAKSITYKVIGGLVDLYFFFGPTPAEVVQQYHAVIGNTALPPYWALGLHQTKWGYATVSSMQSVVNGYASAGLPLDAIWSDIDYMNNRFKNWEVDPVRYAVPEMRAFLSKLHAKGQYWVPIVDAGVAKAKGYLSYEEGVKDGVFVKNYKGGEYMGQVWPGLVAYPSYVTNSPRVDAWLQRQLERFSSQVPFDGLWLDMNEASNFCSGAVCQPDVKNKTAMYWLDLPAPKSGDMLKPATPGSNTTLVDMLTVCVLKCDLAPKSNKLAYPPYALHNFESLENRRAMLDTHIISTTAVHRDGTPSYNVHNLFGVSMTRSHYKAMVAMNGKRPFLLSRSTFPGSGKWTAHWTGDNAANWDNLYYSIAGVLNGNIWGIAMTGADICGFLDSGSDDADPWRGKPIPAAKYEELCNRWASAGAFYPFSRNHMGYTTRDHEFYRWPSVAAAARKAYGLRYQLLTYLYSSLFLAHKRGGTVATPLLFTDPTDLGARNATKQWMLGEAVLVSPVITPNTQTLDAHFTAGAWYSAWTYKPLLVEKGQPVRLDVPLGDIAVHYRGGAIIPLQRYAPVSKAVRFSPVTLIVALPSGAERRPAGRASSSMPHGLDEECSAVRAVNPEKLVSCGLIFADADDNIDITPNNRVLTWFIAMTASNAKSGSIRSKVVSNAGTAKGRLMIEAVHILGVDTGRAAFGRSVPPQPNIVTESSKATALPAPTVAVDGKQLAVAAGGGAAGAVSVVLGTGVLKITGLQLDVGQVLNINWRV